jgi:hypothetical protein
VGTLPRPRLDQKERLGLYVQNVCLGFVLTWDRQRLMGRQLQGSGDRDVTPPPTCATEADGPGTGRPLGGVPAWMTLQTDSRGRRPSADPLSNTEMCFMNVCSLLL